MLTCGMDSTTSNAPYAALAEDPLLVGLLLNAPLSNLRLERQMTAIRRNLLVGGAPASALPALSNLARQCYINEYAWAQDEAETSLVATLEQEVDTGTRRDAASLLLLACYMPLGRIPAAAALEAGDWPEPVRAVLKQQITDGRREAALGASAPQLTPIQDTVSTAVQAQYEANPYPRWSAAQPPAQVGSAQVDILIAGCGTGRSAIAQARSNPGARVLAVDLSRASLGFAMRMAEELAVSNIAFAQGDVLELGVLDQRYDIIECSGVLHHMADPFAGAKTLCGLLKPGGMIYISVYSATARQSLRPAQALARRFPPTTAGIRHLRQAIASAPAGDPIQAAAAVGDFYSISAARDLMMHTHELVLDIADIGRMLDDNALEFRGFNTRPEVRDAYLAAWPDDRRALDLDHWTAFERSNPQAFIGMYQFWARKPG